MKHPWHHIPIGDYEGHMALSSVGQAALLGELLRQTVGRHRPRSLALLGAAGGNGLSEVDPTLVSRVVAVDFQPDYLAQCTQRHAARFSVFEPLLHDLASGPPPMEAVDCVFAGLILEYLPVDVFTGYTAQLVVPGGVIAVVLQLPSGTSPPVTPSPFAASLSRLETAFSFVPPARLRQGLTTAGFCPIHVHRCELPSGKAFHYEVMVRVG